jgi:hypothetical protein
MDISFFQNAIPASKPPMSSSSFMPHTTPQLDFSADLDLASLSGKCALLTGAASGLGAATAVALAIAG